MAWYDTKSAAVDPDNPTADEQVTAAEWNAMRLELRNRLIGRDVDDSNLGDDRILVYDLASNTFVFEDPTTIASLNAIPDVVISGVPADNEGLAYDTATSKWINQTAAEAGLATEAAAVLEADFDATTFLYATADDTPQPKTRAEVMAILSGTAGAEFLFNTQKIGGIVDPTTAQQAATKNYDDTHLFTKEATTDFTNGYVPVYRTASGKFEMEAQSEGSLTNPMTTSLSMGTNKITALVDPTAAQEASTKNYADTHLLTKEAVTNFTDGYGPVYRTVSGKFEMEAAGAAGAVLEADFDATTFMYATADNTPLPKTPAEVMAILSGTAAAEFLLNTQNIGGVVDPTTAQQAATKNYADTHLFTKEATTDFTNGYIAVYRTASGKFEMEAGAETAGLPITDATSIVKGSADSTKQMRMEVDGLTAGATRVMTIPDKDMTLCGTDDALLLSGGTMAGAINIGGYTTTAINAFKAYGSLGISILNYQGTTKLKLGEVDKSFVAYETADMDGHDLDDIGALILNAATELTIATGVVTVTQSYHTIDTEGGDATDNLSTINGGGEGQTLTIRADNSARTVVVQDGLGNLQLEGDMSLDNAQDTISLLHDGTNWLETSRSNNGA